VYADINSRATSAFERCLENPEVAAAASDDLADRFRALQGKHHHILHLLNRQAAIPPYAQTRALPPASMGASTSAAAASTSAAAASTRAAAAGNRSSAAAGDAEAQVCCICLDVMERVTVTSCGHLFCTPCILQAVEATGACPTCRAKLGAKDLHASCTDEEARAEQQRQQQDPKHQFGAKVSKGYLSGHFDWPAIEFVCTCVYASYSTNIAVAYTVDHARYDVCLLRPHSAIAKQVPTACCGSLHVCLAVASAVCSFFIHIHEVLSRCRWQRCCSSCRSRRSGSRAPRRWSSAAGRGCWAWWRRPWPRTAWSTPRCWIAMWTITGKLSIGTHWALQRNHQLDRPHTSCWVADAAASMFQLQRSPFFTPRDCERAISPLYLPAGTCPDIAVLLQCPCSPAAVCA
jgi:hypothetical protein